MHNNSKSESYAAAGVDITAGYKAVELMKKHIARTKNEGCLDDVGGFGGCFGLGLAGIEEPVLVSGTDGCGTKVKMAILMDKHDTIGIDAVAMCVNDIICCGAKPLFFLDYIACGKNIPEKIASIVSGVAEGCVQSGAALIGGETAEHPGMMPVEDYDLAGFAVGVVDKKKILDNTRMKEGDVLVGVSQSGASKDIVEAMRLAKSRGISTICITGTDRSPIMKQSDIVLLTDTEETKHSSLALSSHLSRLVVIDSLCYYLVYRNEANRGDFESENQNSLKSKRVNEANE